jgi:hypothetical protein
MAPVTPPFADVLNAYMRHHVVRELYPEPVVHEGLEKTIHSYVVNLQRENKSEREILVSSIHSPLTHAHLPSRKC